MQRINNEHFREFKLSDLFERAERGQSIRLQIVQEGDMPVIAASGTNQGIAGFYELKEMYRNRITISCNGAGCGSTFYHPYPFFISGDAIALIEKPELKKYFTEYVSLYITTTINAKFTKIYSYEDKCTGDKALNTSILLPSTADGSPDWFYMERYMREMIERATRKLAVLRERERVPKHSVICDHWKEFQIKDLFRIKNAHSILRTSVIEDSGKTPYLTASKENNSVGSYVSYDLSQKDEGNCIFIGGKTSVVTFQKEDFFSNDSHNLCLYCKDGKGRDDLVQLFMCSVIQKTLSTKYKWADSVSKEKIINDSILLPATRNGTPDWAYMKQFMQNMTNKSMRRLSILKDLERTYQCIK